MKQGESLEEMYRRLQRLQMEVAVYRGLYRGALEKLKASRRRAGAAGPTTRSR